MMIRELSPNSVLRSWGEPHVVPCIAESHLTKRKQELHQTLGRATKC